MNILFLSRRYYPEDGGVEKHVREISKRLIANGHSITVITQSKGKVDSIEGVKIVRMTHDLEDSTSKIRVWKWIYENRKLFKEANVIHAHDVYFWYWPLRLMFLSKKSFITFHGYESYPISKKSIIVRKISEFMANGNIIVGDFIKKWYFTNPNFVIYGGVDLPNKPSANVNTKSAVFIGRLDEHTGILDYIKAVGMIKKKYPTFELQILGDGKYFNKIKAHKLLGFKSNAAKYLFKANIAFISRYLGILEALAHKKLVFALYDNPVKEDYLKMSPFSKFIIIVKNADELSERVIYFLENPKKKEKLEEKGYRWVKNQTWEKVTDIYLKLWSQ